MLTSCRYKGEHRSRKSLLGAAKAAQDSLTRVSVMLLPVQCTFRQSFRVTCNMLHSRKHQQPLACVVLGATWCEMAQACVTICLLGCPQASGMNKSSMKRSKSLGDVKEAASSSSPGRAAAAAGSTVWPSGSLAMAKTFSRWRDSPNSSPMRNATSAMQPVGQQGAQALLGSMGAVKAAAQQLSLRRRLGSDAR
jgi:hypothetical protein